MSSYALSRFRGGVLGKGRIPEAARNKPSSLTNHDSRAAFCTGVFRLALPTGTPLNEVWRCRNHHLQHNQEVLHRHRLYWMQT